MASNKRVIILSYYWPPAGGSGVQRWMYFAKYLQQLGWEPILIVPDPKQASYAVLDPSLVGEVAHIRKVETPSREPLRWYARLSGTSQKIPQGEVPRKSLFQKAAAFIRGNFFIPDARKGWVPYAVAAVEKILAEGPVHTLITTGPPHSTHLAALQLQEKYQLRWWADFRDPWSEVFYNQSLYRLASSIRKDKALEAQVLQKADGILTTIGGGFHSSLKAIAPQQHLVALPNGFDAESFKAIRPEPAPDQFHLVYTGLLTQNQAYPQIVRALQPLSEKTAIRWTLAGQIAPDIVAYIQKELPRVVVDYRGYLSHPQAIALMKSASLLLNFSFEGAHQQMISGKLLEYTATQRPILSLGDPQSAAAQFLMQGSAAQMVAPTDLSAISQFLEKVLEQPKPLQNNFPQLEQWSREALSKRLVHEVLEA